VQQVLPRGQEFGARPGACSPRGGCNALRARGPPRPARAGGPFRGLAGAARPGAPAALLPHAPEGLHARRALPPAPMSLASDPRTAPRAQTPCLSRIPDPGIPEFRDSSSAASVTRPRLVSRGFSGHDREREALESPPFAPVKRSGHTSGPSVRVAREAQRALPMRRRAARERGGRRCQ
jgi:hypothetical protein